MSKKEYNYVYGFLPSEVISNLSENDRKKAFLEFISREPTDTGWYMVKTIIADLGDEFIKYLIISCIDDSDISEDDIIENLYGLLNMFATDCNIFASYIDEYMTSRKETKEKNPRDPKTGRWISKKNINN